MFAVTFVGHQGWAFRSDKACILVDPLLCEEFGHAQVLDYRVYPPRQLSYDQFPRVDAVFLSHEHDDHFDIPSLALLDRKIPIFLSSRSSVAGYKILVEMGFSVQPLVPGVSLRFSDLEFIPMCGDHVNTNTGDEWDTLPFLVEHTGNEGSFFSMVDCTLTPAHVQMVKSRVSKAGIVGWTNNTLDRSHMCDFLPERDKATEQFTQRMQAANMQLGEMWSPPSAMLVCAGGFSFYGSRQWLNQRFFCVDTERACKSLSSTYPKQRFFATRPGQTFFMEGNKLKKVEDETPFLKTQPKESWPSRQKGPKQDLPDYAPATGKTELGRKDLTRLRQKLNELADALVGSDLFKALYSLLGFESEGIMTTFALMLRDGQPGQELLFVYNPNACAFDLIDSRAGNPHKTYLAGMECWATDLLAVLSGELGPISISFGRAFLWNQKPDFFNFNIFGELYRMSHPLRRPAEYFRTYERLWKKCAGVQPVILHPNS
jgi:hypothetical protein